MTRYALAAGLLLAGCATTPTPPAVQIRTVEVKVPVAVPCVNAADVPGEPAKIGDRLNGQAAHDLDVVSGSAILLRQWGRELRALIGPCVR